MIVTVKCGIQKCVTRDSTSTYSYVDVTSDAALQELKFEEGVHPDHENGGTEEYAFACDLLGEFHWKTLLSRAAAGVPLASDMISEVMIQAGEFISATKNTGDVDGAVG